MPNNLPINEFFSQETLGICPTANPWSWNTYGSGDGYQESRRFLGSPLIFNRRKTYFQDGDRHYYQEANRPPVLICQLAILFVRIIEPTVTGTFSALVIGFATEGKQFVTTIPSYKYNGRRVLSCFKEVRKDPLCPEGVLQETIFSLIQNCPYIYFINVPKLTGWNPILSGKMLFADSSAVDQYASAYYPESVTERKIRQTDRPMSQVLGDLKAMLPPDWKLKVPIILNVASLLLTPLYQATALETSHIVVFEAKETETQEYLAALCKNYCFETLAIQSIGASRTEIETTLAKSNDATAVFLDTFDVSDIRSIKAGVNALVRDLHHAGGSEAYSRHQSVVLTKTAGEKYSNDEFKVLTLNKAVISVPPRRLMLLMQELCFCVTRYVEKNYSAFQEEMIRSITELKRQLSRGIVKDHSPLMILMVAIAGILLRPLIVSDDEIYEIIGWMTSRQESTSAEQTMINEFMDKLNTKIRNGKLRMAEKTSGVGFECGTQTVLMHEDSLLIEPEIAMNIVKSMTSTQDVDAVMRAMRSAGFLNATNKNRRPITVHSPEGRTYTVHFYCLNQTLLDLDIRRKAENLAVQEFWLSLDEGVKMPFLPLVSDDDHRAVGKLLDVNQEENQHIYLSGQSGYGKTFALSQIAAFYASLRSRVVIFDTSRSFTEKALLRNLPSNFVRSNVKFHSIEEDGIPVDLFSLEGCYNKPNKKNAIFQILAAAAREISVTQANALKKTLADMLDLLNEGEKLHPEDILAMLDPENTTHASMIARLSPVFDDIENCGMSDEGWNQFMDDTKPIAIISTETADTENGTQIVDMLVSSLYRWQRKNSNRPLTIIIDELQNQNFEDSSPISRILKEGRKDRIAFIGATQSYFSKKSSVGDAMAKADTKIFLKPTRDSEMSVASELRMNKAEISRFDRMEIGDCIVKGSLYHKKCQRNCPVIVSGRVSVFVLPDGNE